MPYRYLSFPPWYNTIMYYKKKSVRANVTTSLYRVSQIIRVVVVSVWRSREIFSYGMLLFRRYCFYAARRQRITPNCCGHYAATHAMLLSHRTSSICWFGADVMRGEEIISGIKHEYYYWRQYLIRCFLSTVHAWIVRHWLCDAARAITTFSAHTPGVRSVTRRVTLRVTGQRQRAILFRGWGWHARARVKLRRTRWDWRR